MSKKTRLRQTFSNIVSTPVFTREGLLKVNYPRREWWLDCSFMLGNITQCVRVASSYYCRTISLADEHLYSHKGALQCSPGKPVSDDQLQVHNLIKAPLSDRPAPQDNAPTAQGGLLGNATQQQTMSWLQANRFAAYLHTFASFSGADLVRLSRDDLIQICGLPDGIRLFNALHPRAKTLYLCVQNAPQVYQAVYLASHSSREMCAKAAAMAGLSLAQLAHVRLLGPNGIHVAISDELVRNIKDEATFTTELISDQSGEGLCLLLKPPMH